MRMLPDFQIRARITGVIKTTFAESADKLGRFIIACIITAGMAADDTVKKANMS